MDDLNQVLADSFSSGFGVALLFLKDDQSAKYDPDTLRVLQLLSQRTGLLIKSTLELHTSFEDLVLARRMLRRYPWHGTEISKVKHFELTWFLLQNLCYKFKEKLKLSFNAQKSLCSLLGEEPPSWLKSELKIVDVAHGAAIRPRGNSVHSWDEKQSSIDWFGTVNLFNTMKESGQDLDLPEGFFDIDGHYKDAKAMLTEETSEMESAARSIIERYLQFHAPTPRTLMQKSQKILDAANNGQRFIGKS